MGGIVEDWVNGSGGEGEGEGAVGCRLYVGR